MRIRDHFDDLTDNELLTMLEGMSFLHEMMEELPNLHSKLIPDYSLPPLSPEMARKIEACRAARILKVLLNIAHIVDDERLHEDVMQFWYETLGVKAEADLKELQWAHDASDKRWKGKRAAEKYKLAIDIGKAKKAVGADQAETVAAIRANSAARNLVKNLDDKGLKDMLRKNNALPQERNTR